MYSIYIPKNMYLQSIPVCMQKMQQLKFYKFLPKWLFNWILVKFHQKPVLKQQKHQIYERTDRRWGNFI